MCKDNNKTLTSIEMSSPLCQTYTPTTFWNIFIQAFTQESQLTIGVNNLRMWVKWYPITLVFGTVVRNQIANNISCYTDVCVTSTTKINKTMDSTQRSDGSANSICTDKWVIDRSTFYRSIAVEGSVTKVQDPCDDGHWILIDRKWLCGNRNRAQPVTNNKQNSHIPQCTTPYPTMHHQFLSWMVYVLRGMEQVNCGICEIFLLRELYCDPAGGVCQSLGNCWD